MNQNNLKITSGNAAEWLASCGFLFPSTEEELERFDELYGATDNSIQGTEIDPQDIIDQHAKIIRVRNIYDPYKYLGEHRMVAHKGDGKSTDFNSKPREN